MTFLRHAAKKAPNKSKCYFAWHNDGGTPVPNNVIEALSQKFADAPGYFFQLKDINCELPQRAPWRWEMAKLDIPRWWITEQMGNHSEGLPRVCCFFKSLMDSHMMQADTAQHLHLPASVILQTQIFPPSSSPFQSPGRFLSATGYNRALHTSPAKQNIPFSAHRAAVAEINIILFVGVFLSHCCRFVFRNHCSAEQFNKTYSSSCKTSQLAAKELGPH